MESVNAQILQLGIQALDDTRFVELCNDLLISAAIANGIDRGVFRTNLRVTEPDGGIDARCAWHQLREYDRITVPSLFGARAFASTYILCDGHGAQPDERDGDGMGAHAWRAVQSAAWEALKWSPASVVDLPRLTSQPPQEIQASEAGRDGLQRRPRPRYARHKRADAVSGVTPGLRAG